MLPWFSDRDSNDTDSNDSADGMKSFLIKWAPVGILLIVVVGTVLYTLRTDPEYMQVADEFQSARRAGDFNEAHELISDEYDQLGGNAGLLTGHLQRAVAVPEYQMTGPRSTPTMARKSEGLAVVRMEDEDQLLCLNREEGEWVVSLSPFLRYELWYEDFLPRDERTSSSSSLLTLPATPGPGEGQAKILVDTVWVREGIKGGMRVLLSIKISGINLDLKMESLLSEVSWIDQDEQMHSAGRLLWINIFPDAAGHWPLKDETYWIDLQWDDVPSDEFSLKVGRFVTETEEASTILYDISPPEGSD